MEVQEKRGRRGEQHIDYRKSTLCIKNIRENYTDIDIKSILGEYGQIVWYQRLHSVMALVRFENRRDAEKVLECLGNNSNSNNNDEKPFEVFPKEDNQPEQSVSNGPSARNKGRESLALANLTKSFEDNKIKQILHQFGPIAFYRRNKNFVKAMVRFKRPSAANEAVDFFKKNPALGIDAAVVSNSEKEAKPDEAQDFTKLCIKIKSDVKNPENIDIQSILKKIRPIRYFNRLHNNPKYCIVGFMSEKDTGEVLLEVLKHRERYQFSASFARKQVKESSVEEIIDYLRRQRQQLRENGGQQSDDKEQFFSGNDPESATTNSFEDAPRPESNCEYSMLQFACEANSDNKNHGPVNNCPSCKGQFCINDCQTSKWVSNPCSDDNLPKEHQSSLFECQFGQPSSSESIKLKDSTPLASHTSNSSSPHSSKYTLSIANYNANLAHLWEG